MTEEIVVGQVVLGRSASNELVDGTTIHFPRSVHPVEAGGTLGVTLGNGEETSLGVVSNEGQRIAVEGWDAEGGSLRFHLVDINGNGHDWLVELKRSA